MSTQASSTTSVPTEAPSVAPAQARFGERLRQALAGEQPSTLQECSGRLWRAGIPCRLVRLDESWWQKASDIEGGLWLAFDDADPAQLWLVHQRSGQPRLQSLNPGQAQGRRRPPGPEQLGIEVLSLWPPLEPPLHWRQLSHYLQLGAATRKVLPAGLLRAGVWLLLPALLTGVVLQQLPAPLALALALLSLLLGLLLDNQWQRLWLNRSERMTAALGLNAMQQVLRLPLPLLNRFGGGGAIGLGGALQQLGLKLPLLLAAALPALLLLLLSSAAVLVWQPRLGLISGVAVSLWLIACTLVLTSNAGLRSRQAAHRAESQLRSQELIETASNLRLAGAEAQALSYWQSSATAAERLQPQLDRRELVLAASGVAMVALSLGSAVLLLPAAGGSVALITLVGLQLGSALQLGHQLQQLETLLPSWGGARLLLACPSEARPEALDPGRLKGELTAEGLRFRYSNEQPWVLDAVSFHAPAGSFIAVVGPSGSGKSTLLRLLLGFEQPEEGAILFDGMPAASLQHDLLRPQIGTVLQDARLVGGTMLEVIAAGRQVSVEQAWAAAERAGLADELQSLPMGLQTLVPAGGSNLSGGQRQRLAIARALVGEPRLLLLDEPTSALDNRTQQQVLAGLEQLAITRVLVAHRLSTVRQADQILVLQQGRLVEQGRFEALIHQGGLFAQLMQRQQS